MSVIHYDLRKIPVAPDRADAGYCPVVADSNPISETAIYKRIEKNTSLSEGDVKNALSSIAALVAEQLSQGNAITIPELGTFSLRLTTDERITSATDKRAADHIRVAGINFRAKKKLEQRLGSVSFHRSRHQTAATQCPDVEAAKTMVTTYFEQNPDAVLTSSKMQRLLHCSRTTANLRLSALTADGTLVRHGQRNSPYYRLAE